MNYHRTATRYETMSVVALNASNEVLNSLIQKGYEFSALTNLLDHLDGEQKDSPRFDISKFANYESHIYTLAYERLRKLSEVHNISLNNSANQLLNVARLLITRATNPTPSDFDCKI